MFCTECGKEVKNSDKYCFNCGSENNKNKKTIIKDSKQGNKKSNFLEITVVFIFVILLFFGLFLGGRFLIKNVLKSTDALDLINSSCDADSKYISEDGWKFVLDEDPNSLNSDIKIIEPTKKEDCLYKIRFTLPNDDVEILPVDLELLESFFTDAGSNFEEENKIKISQLSLGKDFKISLDVDILSSDFKNKISKYINELKPQSKTTFTIYGNGIITKSINVEYLPIMVDMYAKEYDRTKEKKVYIGNYSEEIAIDEDGECDIKSNNPKYIKDRVLECIVKYTEQEVEDDTKYLFYHLEKLSKDKEFNGSYVVITDGFFQDIKEYNYSFDKEGYDIYLSNAYRREVQRRNALEEQSNATSTEAKEKIVIPAAYPSFNSFFRTKLKNRLDSFQTNICFELIDPNDEEISIDLIKERDQVYNNFICNNS